jgi:hypothetical protein
MVRMNKVEEGVRRMLEIARDVEHCWVHWCIGRNQALLLELRGVVEVAE